MVRPQDDLIKSLVDHREEMKQERDATTKYCEEYERLDVIQDQLKTLANAISYGIFIEIITEERPTKTVAYGLDRFNAKPRRIEEFGRYFNPILATMLTSGARLMLAMAEEWLQQHGGYYAFCDTDSMAVSPRHWKPLQAFFQPLNPYESSEPLLKLEYDDRGNGRLFDLWFYGISAKRYVLYRIIDGQPCIVKDGWSSHGLGHLLHGTKEGEEDEEIHDEWEKELWVRIIRCANGELSEDELCEIYSGEYAVSKYAVTKPSLHRRLRAINQRKEISNQIKPFNFILIGQAAESGSDGELIHPVTRFTRRVEEAPFQPFIDYRTGKRYCGGSQLYWKPLSAIVREYLNHPEAKFRNGEQTGKMKRRHLHIQKDSIHYIGKEADEIEETEILGVSEDSYVKYG